MIFSRDYLRVFVPLAISFAIYHLTFVPWINKKSFQSEKRWESEVLPQTDRWWNRYFREDSWQRQTPQVLVTELGTFLYQKKVEVTPTRWKIEPLTVLIPQKGTGSSQRAILISNPQGAEIQFQKTPDWTSEAPPIESGRMVGDILIYSPPEDGSNESGLKIATSDIRIERRQISTHMPITMEMGNSLIKGRFLTINLEQKILGGSSNAHAPKNPFRGLENLELTYVDQVEIGLKNGGLWPSKEDPHALQRSARATLSCQGRFTFNFHQSEAVLRGNVLMHHLVDGMPADKFECEELRLQIALHADDITQPTPSVAAEGQSKSPWRLEKLSAVGALGATPNDNSRWLKVNAPGMQVDALGQRLFIDFINGEVNLSNSLPLMTTSESSRVYLRHRNMEIWSPDIHFGNPELFQQIYSETKSAERKISRLGTVVATGPGYAQMEGEKETWKLSWGQKLLVQPAEHLDVISINGSANLNHSIHGKFVANKLNVWLKPVDGQAENLLAGYYPAGEVPDWLPEAIKAEGDVRVEAPELHAKVDSMNVHFTYPTQPANADFLSSQASTANIESSAISTYATTGNNPIASTLSDGTGSVQNAINGLPSNTVFPNTLNDSFATSNSNSIRQPGAINQSTTLTPYNVEAKTLLATVLTEGKKSTMQSLALDGDFQMHRTMLSESSPWPMNAKGSHLRMQQVAPELVNMHLIGEPALITLGSGEVQAPELQLSQSNHLFHIDHPGVLVIPTELLATKKPENSNSRLNSYQPSLPMTLATPSVLNGGVSSGLLAGDIRWIEPPRIQWGSNMTFDGRTARFGGGVSMTARFQSTSDMISHVQAQSNSLAVDLVTPVPLSTSRQSGAAAAELNLIRLEENVEIKTAQTDLNNQRMSTEHIKLPRLDIHMPTQTFMGYGPGELWSRRFASTPALPGMGPSTPSATAPAMLPVSTTAGGGDALKCIHLSFLGRLEGDLKTRKASFYDRIEVLMGPIRNWDDEVNVRLAERLGPGQTSLISDQINIFDASLLSYNQNNRNSQTNSPVAWEIEALSRVRLEAMTDAGRIVGEGNAMKYGAKDDNAQIAGSPTQNALITIFRNNEDPQSMSLSNISFQLKTGAIRGNIERIEGALPSAYQRAGLPGSSTSPQSSPLPGGLGTGGLGTGATPLPSARDLQRK